MKRIIGYFLLSAFFAMTTETVVAQDVPAATATTGISQNYRELHKVKRKETIFGIAREYGISLQELIDANPEMKEPGYELKKGDFIKIPWAQGQQPQANTTPAVQTQATVSKPADKDMRQREIRVGVMLPLHDINGDGKRMVEYYRGVLMACDSLKQNGVSTDIRAWNLAEDGDVSTILQDPHAADRDLIIGPLYSTQVKALGTFVKAHDIRLLIPCSINSTELYDNGNIFQVYQNGNTLNESYVYRFYQRFKDCHPIIIDCNDTTSTKGGFTSALRRKLEQEGITYSITNLKSSEGMFQKCFSSSQRNVVILNTSRSQELNVAFAKLSGLVMTNPKMQISMFGYPEWLQYTRSHLDNFYKFDVYVPSTYYMDPLATRTARLKQKYRWNFHQDMQNYPQRFAAMGFDQAYFMIRGLHLYGKNFSGATGMVGYTPVQTPLHFERIGNGGMQNRAVLFVHYKPEQRVETINF